MLLINYVNIMDYIGNNIFNIFVYHYKGNL